MKTTVQTPRGPVRFHSVGEPIAGIPAPISGHSPLPWSVGGHPKDTSGTNWREILFPSPFGPAYVGQMQKEDAELCVRAVNCHADLLAALEESLSVIRLMGCDMSIFSNSCAALARAKGEQP